MRRAFYLFVSLALGSSALLPLAWASDWQEDDMPRPAPDFRRQAHPSHNDAGDERRTAFYVNPSAGAKKPLQGNVTRSGSGAPLQGNISRFGAGVQGGALQGGTFMRQIPLSPMRPSGQHVPPAVFRGWLEKTHPDFALSAQSLSEDAILDVRGEWDDSAKTLRSFGFRHNSIRRGRLRDVVLDPVKVMIVNCAGKVPRDTMQKVRDFVARGGYLISTDWSLNGCVEQAFPGYIEWNGEKSKELMVDATVTDPDPKFFTGAVSNAWWKVDDGSELVRVLKPSVRVLVRSRQLVAEDPDRMGILACVFSFGRGKVLHVVGHYDNNGMLANSLPDPAPGIGISLRQAMITNFIVEALSKS